VYAIGGTKVHESLDWELLMDAFEEAHRGEIPIHQRHILEMSTDEGAPAALICLPAFAPGEGLGVKVVTSFPRNKQHHNVDTVQSVYLWLDPETGIPEAIIDGRSLIFRKTAADSALGSRLLSRPDSEILLMVGAGALAPYLVRAHLAARPALEEVIIWNRTAAKAESVALQLVDEGISARPIDALETGLRTADIISSATMSSTPLVKGDLLKAGAHVDLVGSFTPEMREGDDDLLRRASIFVDSFGTTERSGEFLGPFARGIISIDDVHGDMAAIISKSVGRQNDDEITLMKNGGGSHFDYWTAREVVRAVADQKHELVHFDLSES
jgi:ornithine cyclodeaminase/alanine dehydrogenase-like protein (mu-crystallin family)